KENLHCQTCCHAQKIQHIGHEEGDQVDIALHHKTKHREQPNTLGYKLTHRGYMFYWIFILTGLVIGIARLAGLPLATSPIMYLGITGTILSITLMLASKKYLADDTHEEAELKLMSLKETLVHTAEETAFVGVWVFVSYVFFGILSYFLDSGIQTALLAGIIPVLIGAAIGIIPGCGPQIVFVSLYSKGLLPFAALVAHSISQDGDALFPLIAMDKKAALQATVITTATALVVGVAFYLLF
ncbi:MAG: putative manganese transporter, partial [Patescibacteria group bacterium]